MKSLWIYLKKYTKESVLSPLFKLLEASFELFVPLVIAAMIDRGINGNDRDFLVKNGVILVLLALIGLICAVSAQFFAAKAAVQTAADIKSALFRRILSFSDETLDDIGTSTLITRMTGDVQRVQTGINLVLRLLMRSPFIVFGSVIMAFIVDSKAAMVFVGVVPVLAIVVFFVMLTGIPLYKKVQVATDKVMLKVRENFSGVRVIRAFNAQSKEEAEFTEDTDTLKKLQLVAGRISSVMNPLTFLIINFGVMVLLYLGGDQVDTGRLTQGEAAALLNYMAQILLELVKLANLIITVVRACASADRIEEVLNSPSEDVRENGETIDEITSIEFENVSYIYQNAELTVVNDISFTVKKGETLGIIGGTGSGKSTLASLMNGSLIPRSGEVRINGKEMLKCNRTAICDRVRLVPQKAVLFSGTIRDNLLWGQGDATDEQMWNALKAAQAEEFVQKTDGKLDAQVNKGGKNFSGGQRQRLSIARALVKNADVLILDDCASALDFMTEASLWKALEANAEDRITVIISQRTSSVAKANQILVMDDGKICGAGTHAQLLSTNEIYREIYESQYGKEAVNG